MDLFELSAKITLDSNDYEKSIDSAEKKTSGFAKKLGSGMATAAKVTTAAIATAATAVGALATKAVSSYAEYEQLVGGVETLFTDKITGSTEAVEAVMENAQNAFKTAGLSANEYMETVTSFSAALLNSVSGDTERAAKLADMAITDMSDNANKMGTDIESLQNAYRGFSRGNFTMLDNLALGFSGTKEGMQQLLDKAKELSGVEYDISSYADMVEAIHVVQSEMGIMGTTAAEAEKTISGSVSSMKSAWDNLVTGLANPDADFGKLIDNLVASASTVFDNLMPVVERSLGGISTLIEKIAPVIVKSLPGLVKTVIPPLLSAATDIINALVGALPDLFAIIAEQVPQIIKTITTTLLPMLPQIVQLGLDLIVSLANGIAENIPEIIPVVVDTILQIVDVLTDPNNLSNLVDAAIAIMIALADGIIDAMPKLIEKVPEIVANLVFALIENAPKLMAASLQMIASFVGGILGNLGKVKDAADGIVNKVSEGIGSLVSSALTWGRDIIQNFINGIKEKWNALKDTISGVAQTVKDFLGFSEPEKGPLSNFHTYAPDMMELFASGIKDNTRLVTDQIQKSFDFGDITSAPALDVSGTAGYYGSVPNGAGVAGGFNIAPQTFNVNLDGETITSVIVDILRGEVRMA